MAVSQPMAVMHPLNRNNQRMVSMAQLVRHRLQRMMAWAVIQGWMA
jgi:hypothetical protein